MADISKLAFLNEEQFKQYVYGTFSELIKKITLQ